MSEGQPANAQSYSEHGITKDDQQHLPKLIGADGTVNTLSCTTYSSEAGLVLVCQKSMPWISPFLPAIPTIAMGLIGFWIVHHLSVQRQRRDEAFKLCQTAKDITHQTAADAAKSWGLPGSDPDAVGIANALPGQIGKLGRILGALQKRRAGMDVNAELVEFRRAATTDIEDTSRLPDQQRVQDIFEQAEKLDGAIDRVFLFAYG